MKESFRISEILKYIYSNTICFLQVYLEGTNKVFPNRSVFKYFQLNCNYRQALICLSEIHVLKAS